MKQIFNVENFFHVRFAALTPPGDPLCFPLLSQFPAVSGRDRDFRALASEGLKQPFPGGTSHGARSSSRP